ncbi:MAG: YggT family protein, partial [Candidatus Accumulibacter sp.]|nr:YggT family protein [Accumulibacter sp.]
MGALVQVVLLIANACGTFFTVLLLMRFFMQWFRAPFDSPIGGFVLHLSNWLVLPLRRIVPAIRGFDSASLLAAYLLQVALLALLIALTPAYGFFDAGTLLKVLIDGLRILMRMIVYLFIVLLVAQAILSWF